MATVKKKESSTRALLLSIRKEHVERIFEGLKLYELRKALPKHPFRRVYLYQTGGGGVVGCFDVGEIIKKPVGTLWRIVGNAATTKKRFQAYFAPVKKGYAIEIQNPLRFRQPVVTDSLNSVLRRLLPPQSYVILEQGQELFFVLESQREKSLREKPKSVSLEKIRRKQRALYRRLVLKHISNGYSDIDASFADANLRVHDLGFDPAGFFTRKKEVMAVNNERGACIGFTTLTYKSGNCLKTGPTILFPQHRGRGYGQATRKAIENHAKRSGIRKLYCTCPAPFEDTISYLLASGMRIEAHLERHYAPTHNEIVFGKLLVPDNPPSEHIDRAPILRGKVFAPNSFRRKVLARDFHKMFCRTWSQVPQGFAEAVAAQVISKNPSTSKPKHMVCLGRRKQCIGAIVLLPKRGGAIKGLLLRRTSHRQSIIDLVNEATRVARNMGGGKLYFIHPIHDSEVVRILRSMQFQTEGLLRAPYQPGRDTIVMSRFL